MKNIVRQAGIILGFLGLWYVFFLFLTYLFYPGRGAIDNSRMRPHDQYVDNIFLKDTTSVLLGFWTIKHDTHRIIIIGSSTARVGIYPSVLQTLLPDFTVTNASVGASTVTQLRQVVDVIRMSSPRSMEGTVFVVVPFYGEFVNDNTLYGHVLWKNKNLTYLQLEALRYGLYKLRDNKVELTIDPYFMPLAVGLLRPFLWGHIIFFDVQSYYVDGWLSLYSMMGKHQEELKGEAMKQNALTLWKEGLGDIKDFAQDPQMNDFLALCQEITQSGASLVIVDLPVPPWVRENSAYYKKYILKMSSSLNEIKKMPRVRYIDLGKRLPNSTDLDFTDSSHPTKKAAEIWSKTVADFIVSQRRFLGF